MRTAAMIKDVNKTQTIDELASAVERLQSKRLQIDHKGEKYWTRAMNAWHAHQQDATFGPAAAKTLQYLCTWEQQAR